MIGEPGQTHGPDPSLPIMPVRRRVDLSDLLPRALSGIVLVIVALSTAVSGGLSFAVLWWLAALTIHWEWQRLLGPDRQIGRLLAGGVAITVADLLILGGHPILALEVLVCGAVVSALVGAGVSHALVGSGVIYAGMLPLAVQSLRASEAYGLEAILWLFAVVWGTDVMAYFGGRFVGGPKLWPRVSPSKTWSGFLIGVGCGALAGLAASIAWGAHWQLVPVGIAAGIVAQAGDLFESTLKRRFGVKDSSRIIPGHGGVMDRLDGFLTAAVFAVCFGMIRFGVGSSAAGLLQW